MMFGKLSIQLGDYSKTVFGNGYDLFSNIDTGTETLASSTFYSAVVVLHNSIVEQRLDSYSC
jgi:hypothetical protein